VQSKLGVGGCGREIFSSATCQLQFAMASASTLSGFIDAVAGQPSRRAPPMSSSRWPLLCSGRLTTDACLYRWRLRQKKSAWASGGPAGVTRVAACLGRWRELLQRAARREVQKPKPPCGLQITQQISNIRGLGCSRKRVAHHQSATTTTRTHYAPFTQQRFLLNQPCGVASFEVFTEPHTGARPSVRLCVGLIF
jgi:hypothetical protein